MEGDRYVLHHGKHRVGKVIERASHGSEARGTIVYDPGLATADPRLARFVSITNALHRHADEGQGDEMEVAATEIADEFPDLVESTEWRLVSESGLSRSICCPVLLEDAVGWSWAEEESPGGAESLRS